jgi:hypothetical protein
MGEAGDYSGVLNQGAFHLEHPFSKCGMRTTTSTPTIFFNGGLNKNSKYTNE